MYQFHHGTIGTRRKNLKSRNKRGHLEQMNSGYIFELHRQAVLVQQQLHWAHVSNSSWHYWYAPLAPIYRLRIKLSHRSMQCYTHAASVTTCQVNAVGEYDLGSCWSHVLCAAYILDSSSFSLFELTSYTGTIPTLTDCVDPTYHMCHSLLTCGVILSKLTESFQRTIYCIFSVWSIGTSLAFKLEPSKDAVVDLSQQLRQIGLPCNRQDYTRIWRYLWAYITCFT